MGTSSAPGGRLELSLCLGAARGAGPFVCACGRQVEDGVSKSAAEIWIPLPRLEIRLDF